MLRLRPYKSVDADTIITWLQDEDTFLKWGGDHFGAFPITAQMMDDKYCCHNGDCAEPDNFYPMVAFDETGVVGHFIMRYLHGDNRILRFGWVIVDNAKRGKGYGREMLALGAKYAFEIMGVDQLSIGVFDTNSSAHRCYRNVGFREILMEQPVTVQVKGENWKIIELEMTRQEYLEQ